MRSRVPELRSHDRACALQKDNLHGHDDHRPGDGSRHREGTEKSLFRGYQRPAVQAKDDARPGKKEHQGDARIANDVTQAVDLVVAPAVGEHDRPLVLDPHEAGGIAPRAAIEPLRSAGREHEEG